MKTDVNIKSLSCPNCGAQLSVSKSTTDIVFCGVCGTKCVITGLNVNDEILLKNNINSGIPLVDAPDKLHDGIFDLLTKNSNFPINVLEKLVINNVRTVSIPAYLFTVSAFANYTYEAGNVRRTEKRRYIEWTQMSAIANDNRTVIVCGNKAYMDVVNQFYSKISLEKLIDVEFLNYPEGTESVPFDYPYAVAYTQHVKPVVEQSINEGAKLALKKKKYRNFNIGAANIQKEYEARISLGIYIVDCSYENQQFSVYFNADATSYIATVSCPDDEARTSYINYLEQEKRTVISNGPSFFSDLFHGGFSKVKENKAIYEEDLNRIKQKINSVKTEPAMAKAEFIKRQCRLKGVFSKGNDAFVWEPINPDVPVMTTPFRVNA